MNDTDDEPVLHRLRIAIDEETRTGQRPRSRIAELEAYAARLHRRRRRAGAAVTLCLLTAVGLTTYAFGQARRPAVARTAGQITVLPEPADQSPGQILNALLATRRLALCPPAAGSADPAALLQQVYWSTTMHWYLDDQSQAAAIRAGTSPADCRVVTAANAELLDPAQTARDFMNVVYTLTIDRRPFERRTAILVKARGTTAWVLIDNRRTSSSEPAPLWPATG